MHVITQKRIWDFPELKRRFPATDKVGHQYVFDIGGNKLRLMAIVQYRAQRLFIQHMLDHREYTHGKWKEYP